MVAECSSAETGLGPSIAPDSHPENGSCADLPNAANTTPALSTCAQPPFSVFAPARDSSGTPAASAAPAAT